MIFRKKGGRSVFIRLLSLTMAVLLSISLIPAVSAEESASEPAEAEEAEVTAATVQEQIPEVTVEEVTKETEDPNAVAEEDFQLVWDQLIDLETEKVHKETIKNITKDISPFLYREILEAMELCQKAVDMQAEQKKIINRLLEKVEADPYLDEAVKSYYMETLDIFWKGNSSMDFKAILLEGMAAYPEQAFRIDEITQAMEGMKQQNTEMENLEDLLDVTDSWQNLNTQLAEYAGEEDQRLASIVDDIRNTAETLKTSIENFFALNDPQLQAGLDEQIEKLEQSVDSLPILRVVLSSPLMQEQEEKILLLQEQIDALQEQLDQMQEKLTGTSGRSVVAFIALAISILAVVMGIVAAVCALKKKDGDNTEALQESFRKDIEAVNAQNGLLRGRIDLLYKKLDEQKEPAPATTVDLTQVHALERRLEALEKDLREKPAPVAKPVADPLPPVVEHLHLIYQSVNPKNSYLVPQAGGEYILYSDNTVALGESEFHKVNELRGWKDNGVLHMFRPEIDGKVYDNYDNLPSGYFQPAELKSRARVKKMSDNMYALLEKGCIAMKR